MKFKKGDSVIVAKGKDRGKKGKIEKMLLKKNQALVGGVNLYKKHLKPGVRGNKEGGIIDLAMPIAISNLRMFCNKCGKGTRVGFKFVGEKKIRICKKCKSSIE